MVGRQLGNDVTLFAAMSNLEGPFYNEIYDLHITKGVCIRFVFLLDDVL